METLRAGLDNGKSAFNGELDGLIITRLEMQAGDVDIGAPVAAEQRILADEIQRPADDAAIIFGHHQQHPVGHAVPQMVEHFMGQIGTAPFPVDG